MKKSGKKLDLTTSTVHVITNPALVDVAGGGKSKKCPVLTTWMTCPR